MAILDPRLLPFIEMLTELDMHWLAFELVEGVRRGEEPVEDESALLRARERSRRASDAGEDIERYGSALGATIPLSGDDTRPSTASAALTVLVLRGGDREHTGGRAEVEGARTRLSGLSEALATWLRNARSDTDR